MSINIDNWSFDLKSLDKHFYEISFNPTSDKIELETFDIFSKRRSIFWHLATLLILTILIGTTGFALLNSFDNNVVVILLTILAILVTVCGILNDFNNRNHDINEKLLESISKVREDYCKFVRASNFTNGKFNQTALTVMLGSISMIVFNSGGRIKKGAIDQELTKLINFVIKHNAINDLEMVGLAYLSTFLVFTDEHFKMR